MMMGREATDSRAVSTECRRMRRPNARYRRADPRSIAPPDLLRLPCPGPTAPVADAASGGVRTFILMYGRGAS